MHFYQNYEKQQKKKNFIYKDAKNLTIKTKNNF